MSETNSIASKPITSLKDFGKKSTHNESNRFGRKYDVSSHALVTMQDNKEIRSTFGIESQVQRLYHTRGLRIPKAAPRLQNTGLNIRSCISELTLALLKKSQALYDQVEFAGAINILCELVVDKDKLAEDRAGAAFQLAWFAYSEKEIDVAKSFRSLANSLTNKLNDQVLQASLLYAQGEFEKARFVAEQVSNEQPKNIEAWHILSQIYCEVCETKLAMRAGARAYKLVQDLAPNDQQKLAVSFTYADTLWIHASGGGDLPQIRVRVNHARVLEIARALENARILKKDSALEIVQAFEISELSQMDRAVNIAKAIEIMHEILVTDPENYDAHCLLIELGMPDFESPKRPKILRLLEKASNQYQAGNYKKVKRIAMRILELDPNESMAHLLYCTAVDRIQEIESETGLIGPISTSEQRLALISHVEALATNAKSEDDKSYSIKDLFPDWKQLTEVQKAMVAYSILGYGKLIPKAIEVGNKFYFKPPGISCAYEIEGIDPESRGIDGHNWYGLRGMYDEETKTFGIMGTEDLDAAAFGAYNTICHEFAHMVHVTIEKQKYDWGVSQNPITFNDALKILYKEAGDPSNEERFLESYSALNILEYWAQGAMAYLNPHMELENKELLYQRNPHLYNFVKDRIQSWRSFPEGVLIPEEIEHTEMNNSVQLDEALEKLNESDQLDESADMEEATDIDMPGKAVRDWLEEMISEELNERVIGEILAGS